MKTASLNKRSPHTHRHSSSFSNKRSQTNATRRRSLAYRITFPTIFKSGDGSAIQPINGSCSPVAFFQDLCNLNDYIYVTAVTSLLPALSQTLAHANGM
jgi:hypothetical protein